MKTSSGSGGDLASVLGARLGHTAAPVRTAFTDVPDEGGVSPLASMLRASSEKRGGGRGGKSRLAIYLSLLWVIRKSPYNSDRPARFWADIAGMKNPSTDGSRAARDALHTLSQRNFVKAGRGASDTILVDLLKEDRSGAPYGSPVPPRKGMRASDQYFRIPASLWETQMIGEMSGAALAMYVISLRYVRVEDPRVWFSPKAFKEKFGLGDSTRKTGLRDLVELGVFSENFEIMDSSGGEGYVMRKRKVYTIADKFLPVNRNI